MATSGVEAEQPNAATLAADGPAAPNLAQDLRGGRLRGRGQGLSTEAKICLRVQPGKRAATRTRATKPAEVTPSPTLRWRSRGPGPESWRPPEQRLQPKQLQPTQPQPQRNHQPTSASPGKTSISRKFHHQILIEQNGTLPQTTTTEEEQPSRKIDSLK